VTGTPPRFVLQPASRAQLAALKEAPDAFAATFGLSVLPGYLEFPEALPYFIAQLDAGADPEWWSHLFVDTTTDELVGLVGFKGPPVSGAVEIGYSIATSRRGAGLATLAAGMLTEKAARRGATSVIAHTLPGPNASTAVLEHLGFTRAPATEPADAWRWELPIAGPDSKIGQAAPSTGRRD
jgi:[ribosomal protein S5]-alanine N-acetyltransferase